MRVTVISPERAVFDGEAQAVLATAFDGEIGILPNHAPLMTVLGTGTLRITTTSGAEAFRVQGGFLQVVNNSVRILAEQIQGDTDA